MKTPPTLEEKIQTLRDEIDAAIDDRAAELKATMPGVPLLVVRNILTRNSDCACQAYLAIKASDL